MAFYITDGRPKRQMIGPIAAGEAHHPPFPNDPDHQRSARCTVDGRWLNGACLNASFTLSRGRSWGVRAQAVSVGRPSPEVTGGAAAAPAQDSGDPWERSPAAEAVAGLPCTTAGWGVMGAEGAINRMGGSVWRRNP